MSLTIEDIDVHAAVLQDSGVPHGNKFWQCMCQFISTFSDSAQERKGWLEFLVEWRTEIAETESS